MTTTSKKVITWQSPAGAQIDICEACEAAAGDDWPRDSRGQEFCTVSQGLHTGRCDLCEEGNHGE